MGVKTKVGVEAEARAKSIVKSEESEMWRRNCKAKVQVKIKVRSERGK